MSDNAARSLTMLRELADRIDPPPVFWPLAFYERRAAHRGLPRYLGSTAQRRACTNTERSHDG